MSSVFNKKECNMTITQPDPFSSFSDFLRSTIGDLLVANADSFVDMVADDIVIEFPYAPPNFVPRIEGKKALIEYLPNAASLIAIESISVSAQHRTRNSNIVVLEFTCKGTGVKTRKSYDQTYISVVTLANGYITYYRDYWNPLVLMHALGSDDVPQSSFEETDNEK